ncbi:MAG: 3-phosphoglycerate dehydrogenase [Verrucomicrobia bacterium]|nr:3-phosphoglycerate dehydrogenase [Verrucomicrobiota bacterium]
MLFKKIKILIVDPLHPDTLNHLQNKFDITYKIKPTQAELEILIEDAEVIILRSGINLNAALIDRAKDLKVIARAGVGMDNIDLEKAQEKGIFVFNVPNESSRSVAEFGFGLILALGRKIALADAQMRRGLIKKTELEGFELQGKVLGLIGLGHIGTQLAQIAHGFEMGIVANVANPTAERQVELAERGISLRSLDQVLSSADVICLALPLTKATEHLIRLPHFRAMKPSAILINLSRAKIIDFNDLLLALHERLIRGIATDVVSDLKEIHTLSQFENVVLTPHIGAMTQEAQCRIGQKIIKGIEQALGTSSSVIGNDRNAQEQLLI